MGKKFSIMMALVFALLLLAQTCPATSATEGETVSLPVIMYHHINKNSKYWNDYTISPEKFREDLEYIKSAGYNVITASQLAAFEKGESELPEKPIMITFDDGFESFLTYAVPLLEEFKMPALMTIVGHYADIYSESQDHNINYSHLSWEELLELSNSEFVELGIHTYDMHSLGERKGCNIKPGESEQQFRTEFNADLEKIETKFIENLGYKPPIFAYPYGIYCDAAKEILIERGYQMLFTCDQRVNKFCRNEGELLQIGRFNRPSSMTSSQFFDKLA